MQIDINAVLETLKVGKSAKTQASLDKLNETLKTYFELGKRDFSITTIGRVSEEARGVGYQSIRATANKHYRDLIEGRILQPLKIKAVRKGFFQDYMKSIGKLGGQNKVPRLSNERNYLESLLSLQ